MEEQDHHHHNHSDDDNDNYNDKKQKYRALIFTFITYAAFHASRKPPSIVKSVLTSTWPPFDNPLHGPHRVADLDLAFLSSYSLSMFLSGHLADRLPLRLFLFTSALLSGLASVLFALGFFFRIHALSFYLIVQIFSGIFQSAAWPCVVAVVGNWFGNSDKKGLVMGIWNSHTCVGNILGSVVASAVLEFGWGWSFALPGILIILVGLVVVYGLLIFTPAHLNLHLGSDISDSEEMEMEMEMEMTTPNENGKEDIVSLVPQTTSSSVERAIGFLEAWRLPGVAPFAFTLFFSKLVAYTFLYWLPFYIRHTRNFLCLFFFFFFFPSMLQYLIASFF